MTMNGIKFIGCLGLWVCLHKSDFGWSDLSCMILLEYATHTCAAEECTFVDDKQQG